LVSHWFDQCDSNRFDRSGKTVGPRSAANGLHGLANILASGYTVSKTKSEERSRQFETKSRLGEVWDYAPTAFEAAQLIKPPASRGVSDFYTLHSVWSGDLGIFDYTNSKRDAIGSHWPGHSRFDCSNQNLSAEEIGPVPTSSIVNTLAPVSW